ncbi:MAG: helix-turn-helix transcriptional regulator [Hoylesella shahii]|uniref:helix-turn-helix transcriptional regulator n=1 Tax=Hoylesella shahii TaxID=228603 RepID=UPI001CB2DEEE|nr:helix-turn-helix transcriptional regulator [Hoylesella shahii]MBF1575911.1 helix-turn-helix transcriptional regulator [Hoylesella shahii]
MDKDLNRIRVVLVEQKRTSRWLANELGKDETTVSKWCTNRVQPTLETMFAIAKVLNVSVQDLLTNELN